MLCKIYVTALKIKIYVKLSSLSLQKRLLKQKWLFRCNLIFLFVQGAKRWKQRRAVVLFRLFCCTKQTFASFNVDVFRQQGETQLTFQLLAQKQKWLFRCNLMVVLICARCKEVETASCSCFVSALLLHETNFCLFQRGRFQTTRRNTTDIPTACTKTKVAFSLQFDGCFDLCKAQNGGNSVVQLFCFCFFIAQNKLLSF